MLQIDPNHVRGLFLYAQVLIQLNNFDDAKSKLEHLLQIEPNNTAAKDRLAKVDSKLGKKIFGRVFSVLSDDNTDSTSRSF